MHGLLPFAAVGGVITEFYHAVTGTWLKNGHYVNVGGHQDHVHVAIRKEPRQFPRQLSQDPHPHDAGKGPMRKRLVLVTAAAVLTLSGATAFATQPTKPTTPTSPTTPRTDPSRPPGRQELMTEEPAERKVPPVPKPNLHPAKPEHVDPDLSKEFCVDTGGKATKIRDRNGTVIAESPADPNFTVTCVIH